MHDMTLLARKTTQMNDTSLISVVFLSAQQLNDIYLFRELQSSYGNFSPHCRLFSCSTDSFLIFCRIGMPLSQLTNGFNI